MRTVTVKLNQKEYAVEEGTSLAAFIASLGLSPRGIAVAVADRVVPKTEWDDTILTDGMELMLIHAVSGG
jgi:sulfur carrier protein